MRRSIRWMVCLAALVVACVPDETPAEPERRLGSISIEQGRGQVAVEGEALPERIIARALMNTGEPALSFPVYARVTSGNGGVRAGGFAMGNGGMVGGQTGVIEVQWIMGPADEAQRLDIFAVQGSDTVWAAVTAEVLPASEPLEAPSGAAVR